MSNLLEALEANLRAELEGQRALLLALEAKVQALRSMDRSAIERTLEDLAKLGMEAARLGHERRDLVERLAKAFGMSPRNLKLKEIASRAGDRGAEIGRIRVELLEAAAKVHDLSRKLGLLVKHYREVYGTALDLIFRSAGLDVAAEGDSKVPAGMVINAEG